MALQVSPNSRNPNWRAHLLVYAAKISQLKGSGTGKYTVLNLLVTQCTDEWIDRGGYFLNAKGNRLNAYEAVPVVKKALRYTHVTYQQKLPQSVHVGSVAEPQKIAPTTTTPIDEELAATKNHKEISTPFVNKSLKVSPRCRNPLWKAHLLSYGEKIAKLKGSGTGKNTVLNLIVTECTDEWMHRGGYFLDANSNKLNAVEAISVVKKALSSTHAKHKRKLRKSAHVTFSDPPQGRHQHCSQETTQEHRQAHHRQDHLVSPPPKVTSSLPQTIDEKIAAKNPKDIPTQGDARSLEVSPNCRNPNWKAHLLTYSEKIAKLKGSGTGKRTVLNLIVTECTDAWIHRGGYFLDEFSNKLDAFQAQSVVKKALRYTHEYSKKRYQKKLRQSAHVITSDPPSPREHLLVVPTPPPKVSPATATIDEELAAKNLTLLRTS